MLIRALVVAAVLVAVLTALVGLVFAGSTVRVAEGITIAGVDVGGLTETEARALLERRAAPAARVPIVFTVGEQRFAIKSATLGVEPDWSAALATALREGSGFAPVRGYKRLQSRFLGTDIVPPVRVYTAALEYKLGQIADAVDRRHVEAKLVRRGLAVAVVPGQVGRTLERKAAANTIVRALAGLERGKPVALPVVVDPIDVTAADLALVAKQARVALSAPVRLVYGETRWKLPRWRLAQLIELPSGSSTRLSIAGKQADAWFARLRKRVDRAPADARFATSSGAISIVPSKPGLAVEVPATAAAILAAAVSPSNRTAQLVVGTSEPKLTTADARGLGIERRLGTYTTLECGHVQPDHEPPAGDRAPERRARRAGRHLLLQRPGRPAHGRARVPARAGDHPRRVRGGRRRRRLPGRHDRLQRGVGERGQGRRAQSALALHQPLPARPRRNRQLPRPRPQVRQRHAEVDPRRRELGRGRHHGLPLRRRARSAAS